MYRYSKDNINTIHKEVVEEDVFLTDFYSHDIGFTLHGIVLSLPNSESMQNLLTPKDNLVNDLNPIKTSSFLKDILGFCKKCL